MANPWASRSLVSATEWETNRAVITDLYQNQNKTLKTVMEIMRDEYNFDATTKMYKSRFEQWGLQKNLKSKQVGELLRQKTARDAVGKSTALYIRGKKIPEEKLKAYIQRTSNVNQIWLNAAAPGTSSARPDAQTEMAPSIVCRTPSPAPSSLGTSATMATPATSATSPTSSQFSTASAESNPSAARQAAVGSSGMALSESAAAGRIIVPIARHPPLCTHGRVSPIAGKQGVALLSTADRRREALRAIQSKRPRLPGHNNPLMPSTSYMMPLATPRSLAIPEECMYILRDYVYGNFSSGLWNKARPPLDAENDRLIDWHDNVAEATTLLRRGESQSAFALINQGLEDYNDLLRAQNFKLFIYTYSIMVEAVREFPGIVKAILKHVSGLAQIMFKSHHPLSTIMRRLCEMDARELRTAARFLIESYMEFLEDHLDDTSDFMMLATMARCSTMSNLETFRLCDPNLAQETFARSIAKMERRHGAGCLGVSSAKVYSAHLYLQYGQYREARQRAQPITDANESTQDRFVLGAAHHLMFRVACEEGNLEDIINAGHNWIGFSARQFGDDHYRTAGARLDLDRYLRENGHLEMEKDVSIDIGPATDEVFWATTNSGLKVEWDKEESDPQNC